MSKKIEINNINSSELAKFFDSSNIHGDQVLELSNKKIFSKCHNKSKSNIGYREMVFDDDVVCKSKEDFLVKFYVENYSNLYKVANSMKDEEKCSIKMTVEDDICAKLVISNSHINFDFFASQWKPDVPYIDGDKWNIISNPKEFSLSFSIDIEKIKSVVRLHKITKYDTEKLNIVSFFMRKDDLVMSHDSSFGKLEFIFSGENSNLVNNNFEGVCKVQLDIFNSVKSHEKFDVKFTKTAMYLFSENKFLNISSLNYE